MTYARPDTLGATEDRRSLLRQQVSELEAQIATWNAQIATAQASLGKIRGELGFLRKWRQELLNEIDAILARDGFLVDPSDPTTFTGPVILILTRMFDQYGALYAKLSEGEQATYHMALRWLKESGEASRLHEQIDRLKVRQAIERDRGGPEQRGQTAVRP